MAINLFELEAILRLNTDDFNKGIDNAEKEGTGFIQGIANTWTRAKSKFQTVSTILKPVTDLIEDVVDNYSNYQQLIGGIDKLFGDSAKRVADNAKAAFRTAGLSINSYMEMTTSMASSLIQSLGGDTEAAADLVDVAIQDMADNVNTFGTSMEMVQNAYRGLARGNFTMLDNLALGYQGSQAEMFRLMNDASTMDADFARTARYSMDQTGHLNASYADMIRAIHIIQENMGITGTTQKEAANTVSGSNASMKAALENLKTIMGDPKARQEEIEEATTQFTESLKAWLKNITPIIVTAVKTLFDVVGTLLDNLFKELGIETDFKGFLKSLANAIIELLPVIADAVKFLAEKFGWVFEGADKGLALLKWAFGVDPGGNDDLYGLKQDEEGRFYTVVTGTDAEYKAANGGRVYFGKDHKFYDSEGNETQYYGKSFMSYDPETEAFINSLPDSINTETATVQSGSVDVNGATVNVNGGGSFWDSLDQFAGLGGNAKGLWDVPFDDYYTRLHRGEMVLTTSEARDYREGNGVGTGAIVGAIQELRNDMQNLRIMVGKRVFGQTVVDYSGKKMSNYMGKAENREIAGYGGR